MSTAHTVSIIDHAVTELPTSFGKFVTHAYLDSQAQEHLVLVKGSISSNILCRVHSECLTGNVFFSQKCDCADQLTLGLDAINKERRGIFMYLRQEGRGIGLVEKIKAYELQQKGYDTYDANTKLGHEPDARDYYIAYLILHDLNVSSIRLLSNNPDKVLQLSQYGIKVNERISLLTHNIRDENREYLRVKVDKFQHDIDTTLL